MGRLRRDPPRTPSGILIKSLSFLGSEMHKLSDGRRWRSSICPILCAMSFRERIRIQWVADASPGCSSPFMRDCVGRVALVWDLEGRLLLIPALLWIFIPTSGWFTFTLLCHETLGARAIPMQAEVLPRSGVQGTTGKLHPQPGPCFSFVLCLTSCFITRGCQGFLQLLCQVEPQRARTSTSERIMIVFPRLPVKQRGGVEKQRGPSKASSRDSGRLMPLRETGTWFFSIS